MQNNFAAVFMLHLFVTLMQHFQIVKGRKANGNGRKSAL
jgi:hypothetical protein